MELLQLRYFTEVARTQNMSRAAASLHVSQPTISGSIKRLEAELGVELFDRHGRSIRLNDKGDLFLQSIRQAITGIDAAVGTVRGLSAYHTGKVSIGVFVPFTYVRDLIVAFAEANPAVTFEINGHIEDASDMRLQAFDIVFFPDTDEFVDADGAVLDEDPLGVALCRHHPLAQRSTLALAELAHEEFVFQNNSPAETEFIRQRCEAAGFAPIVRLTCNSAIAQKQLIGSGLAIGFVRAGYREEYVEQGDIVFVPLEDAGLSHRILFTAKRRDHLTRAARGFLDHIETTARKHSSRIPESNR